MIDNSSGIAQTTFKGSAHDALIQITKQKTVMIFIAEAESLLQKPLSMCIKNTELLMQQPNKLTSKLNNNSNVLLKSDRNLDHTQEGP